MSDEPAAFGTPEDSPLLRELQRVLLAGTGPVNWELARQLAIASASWGTDDPSPTEDDQRVMEGAARMAELAVADLTGVSPPTEASHVRAVRRAQWVEANVRGLRGLFEPGAERLARALAENRPEEPSAAQGTAVFEALMDRLAPLFMGAQVGMVLGQLAQRALGQYDLPLPRTEEPALLFVIPNMDRVARDWSLPGDQFRAWVALHETAHAFGLARPWARDHVAGMLREVAEAMQFDIGALQERLEGLDLSDPERLSDALGGELLAGELDDEQRLLLRRVQAFVAAAEGHADHVLAVLGRQRLPDHGRIDEALRRRHEERGTDERAAERLLGIGMDLQQYRLGRAFCDHVAEQTDERTLARMWESAETLPSMPELEEPTLWLARMA